MLTEIIERMKGNRVTVKNSDLNLLVDECLDMHKKGWQVAKAVYVSPFGYKAVMMK